MLDLLRDITLAGACILVLVALNRVSHTQKPVPKRVWSYLLAGFGLLLCGRVVEMLDPATLMLSPLVKVILQEVIGFCFVLVLLSIGLIRWLPALTGGKPASNPQVVERKPAPSQATPSAPLFAVDTSATGHSAQEMLTSVLKSSLSGVLVLKAFRDEMDDIADFQVQLVNDAAQQILGRSASNLIDRCLLKEFPCIRSENLLGHMISVVETGLPFRDERLFNHDREGRWYQYVAVKLRDGLAVTFGDISNRKRAEEQLRHAAHHDTLTGLPNRALFSDRLEQAITRAKRSGDLKFAVLFLDFDRFKYVNDTIGHDAGDQLLIAIAGRLRECLDTLEQPTSGQGHLPARLGGDEFVILLEDIAGVSEAVKLADKLLVELSVPHDLSGHEVVSTASIGIVMSDLGYKTPHDMIRDADTAMYQAKTTGKARYVVFDARIHERSGNASRQRAELHEAVQKRAFELRFDPIVTLEGGQVAGFETVVRWLNPSRGEQRIGEFLDVVQQVGLGEQVGESLLKQACEQIRSWRDAFPDRKPVFLNVGVLPQHLQKPSLVPLVKRLLKKTGIGPAALRLQVTEAMVMTDLDVVVGVLEQLSALGVSIVLDEFGTEHSSLTCLHRFPIAQLKLSPEFASSARNPREYAAIIKALVTLAHNLDMEVVAPCIDASDELVLLEKLECDFAQGAAFSEALTAEQVETLLGGDGSFRRAA